jgi:outer membrane protein, heavy metal efflux system
VTTNTRSMRLRIASFIFLSLSIVSCATYRPAPLKPAEAADEFARRTLAGPDLCRYLRANLTIGLTACPPASWDLATLTLAGFFYSPDLVVADAKLKVAQAAIITAGERPNPDLGIGTAYAATAVPNFAPWALGAASINFPIETAGKRGYWIAKAQRLTDAAALGVGETAWRVRTAVRAALLNHLVAQREYTLVQNYESVSERITHLLQERVVAGAASAADLNLALANAAAAQLKVAQARSRIAETLNALAIAVGVPVNAVQDLTFAWPEFEHPPDDASLTATRVTQLALLNRIDLRRTLAQYAAADEALKLEIARQYPDINLGGGYSWEVNENIFDLLPVVTLPLMNQNQGPIAEARATRAQVAAEFVALQDTIIGEANSALTGYRGELAALQQGWRSAAFSQKRLAAMQSASALGEIDAPTLATAQLETVIAKQSALTALAEAQAALGALEDAVERPLEDGGLKSFTLPEPLKNTSGEQNS